MERLTIEQIDAITAMLADATPGPWALSDAMTITTDDPPERAVYIAYAGESIRNRRNMPLIVALRNAAPALLAAAREAEGMREMVAAAKEWDEIRRDYEEFDGDRRSISAHLGEAERKLRCALSALPTPPESKA